MVDRERRKVLQMGLAAAVAVPLVPSASAAAPEDARSAPDAEPARDEPARERLGDGVAEGPIGLFAPYGLGDELGMGWSLADLRAPDRGAMLLLLSGPEGAQARVHICANPGCAAGLASTDALDFILMNGGAGDGASDEALGRVVRRLATIASANAASVPAGLLPHEERIERWLRAEPGALL